MTEFGPDPDLVRRLAQLLAETGLGEIEYTEGERRIRVARPTTVALAGSTGGVAAPADRVVGAEEGAAAATALPAGTITAPMVGTVYLASEPGAAPFVQLGDTVKEGQTLLIIEAMKVMNPIRSPRGGRVTHVFVADAAPVEYGEPLLAIE
jgi:acetyl-CoA carboxylase biotin carboxyl carrier protein